MLLWRVIATTCWMPFRWWNDMNANAFLINQRHAIQENPILYHNWLCLASSICVSTGKWRAFCAFIDFSKAGRCNTAAPCVSTAIADFIVILRHQPTNSACKLIWFSSTFTRFNCAGQVFVSAVSMQWWHARWAPLVRKSCEYFFFCVTLETHVGSWHAPYRGASQYFVMRASIYMRLFSVLRCNQHQRA